ncbi:LysR family transcriptional regulator [Sinorhizobium meliloti]|uniref:LysR substrate-binding domain-containing protein n=1 Tax=Rhizobium meliloti TaxID=382 RepID=UPI001F453DC3|nr:LysR family transcriptional regulator [Sinorhizobium meliloti]
MSTLLQFFMDPIYNKLTAVDSGAQPTPPTQGGHLVLVIAATLDVIRFSQSLRSWRRVPSQRSFGSWQDAEGTDRAAFAWCCGTPSEDKPMDLRHLRYVVAAARNGSFSAAGHELNVRQPIISKRIRELEDELGVFLFDRATSGARLTPTGEEFVVGARRIIDAFQRLSERAKANGVGKTGRLVIGYYKSMSSACFRISLETFRNKFHGVEVELLEASYIELKAGVISGTIDLAIVVGETGRTELLSCLPLWSAQLVVALPEDHSLAEKTTIYWPELKGGRFLISHDDPGPDIRNVVLRHLAAPSDHPEIVMRQLSRESILAEVASGQGISLQCEGAHIVPERGIILRPVHDGNGGIRLGYIACWRPDNSNPVLKNFFDTFPR